METGKITSLQALRLSHEAASIKKNTSSSDFAEKLREKAVQASDFERTAQMIKPATLQFSKHAEQRMEQRGVQLSEDNLADLSRAVEKARQKGSKDTVVIGQHGAFIVNVQNNVVITTITEQEMKQNIFTNIDSAVFI